MATILAASTLGLALFAGSTPAAAEAAPHDPWVYSWGPNGAGQLGNGTTTERLNPGPVLNLARADVKSIAAGGLDANTAFAVTLLKNGTVKSWGKNAYGQLGNGTTNDQTVPASVVGLTGVEAVAAGRHHALALKDGRVLAWGRNDVGQLGNGNFGTGTPEVTAKSPVDVQSLENVTAIAAGAEYSLALRADGTVWAWGSNVWGTLGNGKSGKDTPAAPNHNTPQQVPGLTGITDIAAGAWHALALTKDHTVKAWGYNSSGQIGNDAFSSTVPVSTPTDVKDFGRAVALAAGGHHTLALLDNGTVKAWGANASEQLGERQDQPPAPTFRTTPVLVKGLTSVKELAAGYATSLAVLEDGSVVAWGSNSNGQLGDGTKTNSRTPVMVLPPGSGINHLAAARDAYSVYAY
ncbi:hypothetical protein GCM10014713_08560 [Streptomyces purpureus]|uniref:RCC1-like domain-containing protein n=1 Tax=Streptomyces purpureus TaxID=1951 RepID=A0A918GX49_9ACTN|nr:hypothetical protein GCM10014713_08560 [Streptomyces purpureus]